MYEMLKPIISPRRRVRFWDAWLGQQSRGFEKWPKTNTASGTVKSRLVGVAPKRAVENNIPTVLYNEIIQILQTAETSS